MAVGNSVPAGVMHMRCCVRRAAAAAVGGLPRPSAQARRVVPTRHHVSRACAGAAGPPGRVRLRRGPAGEQRGAGADASDDLRQDALLPARHAACRGHDGAPSSAAAAARAVARLCRQRKLPRLEIRHGWWGTPQQLRPMHRARLPCPRIARALLMKRVPPPPARPSPVQVLIHGCGPGARAFFPNAPVACPECQGARCSRPAKRVLAAARRSRNCCACMPAHAVRRRLGCRCCGMHACLHPPGPTPMPPPTTTRQGSPSTLPRPSRHWHAAITSSRCRPVEGRAWQPAQASSSTAGAAGGGRGVMRPQHMGCRHPVLKRCSLLCWPRMQASDEGSGCWSSSTKDGRTDDRIMVRCACCAMGAGGAGLGPCRIRARQRTALCRVRLHEALQRASAPGLCLLAKAHCSGGEQATMHTPIHPNCHRWWTLCSSSWPTTQSPTCPSTSRQGCGAWFSFADA